MKKTDHTTEAQKRAIHARGRSVCVAAGAGSGKTFVLVERFARLVQDGIDAREILTITFTEKAAREMRERIGVKLDGPGLERARVALEGAWISTIHGFCARLLRTYSVEADVDPQFGVLTELPLARVRRAAFAEAQAGFRREWPEAYDAIVDRIKWGHDQEGFAGIDLRVYALHEAQRAAGERAKILAPDERPASFVAIDADAVKSSLDEVARALRHWESAFTSHARPSAVARDKVESVGLRVRGLADSLRGGFVATSYVAIQQLLKTVRGNGLFRDERAALAVELERLAHAYVEGPARALGAAVGDLIARFDAAFRARKAQLSALDFGDLEERARELLESNEAVRDEVRRRFKAILIDEFQDTSRLQQRLIDLVRRPDAFFAVGDVKQAVYGFRHAEVKGLLEVESEVQRTGGLVVPLDTSFRTRPSVLAYVDAVFAPIFGEAESEVPHQPLRSAETVAFAEKNAPSVEVILAHGESLEHGRGAEARAIAGRLAAIVEGKLLQGTNPLRQDSFGKPLRYKDCAILFRAMTELQVYERALRERGVPYRVDRGGGFFDAPDVVDAVNLLRAIADPGDDLALAAVLRSPIGGFSDDALLALARDRVKGETLSQVFERSGNVFAGTLATLRGEKGRTRARDLLARALDATGLPEAALLRTGSARGYANLKKLLAIVEGLESDPAMGLEDAAIGLDDVVFALEDLRASAAREAEVSLAGGDEDAVLLLTVHAAKGLEWPLVVVADLGRSDNPWAEPVAFRAEPGGRGGGTPPTQPTGCIPLLVDPTSPWGKIEPEAYARLFEEKKRREREESKRLLYVALTRARDHLILAGARGGHRESGPWLAWSLRPLDLGQKPLALEDDEAVGAKARVIPGPDPRGVRVTQVGTPVEEGEVAPAPARPVLAGPLGPEAGARSLLDRVQRERVVQGLLPAIPESEGGPGPADRELAAQVLARASRPLPEADLSGSFYIVTEVLAHEACPRLYLYEQLLGARSVGTESLVADEPRSAASDDEEPTVSATDAVDDPQLLPRHILGTVTHRILELGRDRKPSRVREILAEETKGALSARGLAAANKLVLEWVDRFERSPIGQRTHAAEARSPGQPTTGALREAPFLVRVEVGNGEEPVLLRGTADLILREDKGAVLVDYKTNELTPLQVPAKAREYALQLQLYALAVSAYLGEPVREAWLSFLVADLAVQVDVSPPALEGARRRLAAFVAARRRGEFPPRPGTLCGTCAFRTVCPGARSVVSPAAAIGVSVSSKAG